MLIQPGDTITSACRSQIDTATSVGFGELSTDEMCFAVMWAWPTGQRINDSLLGELLGATSNVTLLEP